MGSLLLLLLALAVIGYPVRLLLRRLTPITRDLDLLQRFILDVYSGGLVLYIIALLPFRAFTSFTAVLLVVVACFITAFILSFSHIGRLLNLRESLRRVRANLRQNALRYLGYAATGGLFLLIFWVVFSPTEHYVFGSIHDTSLHSLFTQVIIENGHIPETLAPYEPTGIVQPIGGHPIFAFATYLFDWSAPSAVFQVTPLFIALLVLGGYFLGKCISGRTSLGFLLAAALSLVASHPVYMTWGGNAFALAYPLLLVCLGFLVLLLRSKEENKGRGFLILFPLFGYLMALHVSVFIAFALTGGVCCVVNGLMSRALIKKAGIFFITNLAALLLVAPFLWRYLVWRGEPGHNIGLPADVVTEWFASRSSQIPPMSWIAQQISPYHLLQALTWLLVGLGLILMTKQWRSSKAVLLPLALSIGLIPLFLTWFSRTVAWAQEVAGGTTATMGYVGLSLVVAYFLDTLHRQNWTLPKRLPLRGPWVGLLLVALILSPYVYYRVQDDPQLLNIRCGMYAVTRQDDLRLMEWIGEETGPEAVILTNAFEPGMFIPSMAHRKIVFAYTGSQNSLSYQGLVHDLHEGKLDKTSYDTMKRFGVTHLYIGSQASQWVTAIKWYPKFFLDNPNFKLVKSYGDAYLLEVLYMNPDLVFAEDFSRPNFEEEGWMLYVPQYLEGNGEGDIVIEVGAAPQGMNSARLSACKNTGEFYWTSMVKAVYLGGGTDDENHVQISFGLRAAEGFRPDDKLMLVVSDGDWQRQVYFVVPPGAYWKPELQVLLPEAAAWQQLDLSQLWYDIHGSSLPDSFYVQIINFDTDGITNVAYFDYIQISRGGSTA